MQDPAMSARLSNFTKRHANKVFQTAYRTTRQDAEVAVQDVLAWNPKLHILTLETFMAHTSPLLESRSRK
jgi:hypothetical protein